MSHPAAPIDVLWHGAGPWGHSAYALQGALVTASLRQRGVNIGYSADVSANVEFRGCPVWPAPRLSGRSLAANARAAFGSRAGRIVAFVDYPRLLDEWPDDREFAFWAPVHFDPLPAEYVDAVSTHRVRPIAVSEFARDRLAAVDVDAELIPHGLDPELLSTVDRLDRSSARASLGLPDDAFVVTTVAVNSDWRTNRKSLPELACAVADIQRRHSDVMWHLHSQRRHTLGGLDLDELFEAVGIAPNRVVVTDPDERPSSTHDLAATYRAGDLAAHPSGGEGFGIPVIEAQASGVPVLVSNFSAQPELVHQGWIVEGQRRWVPGVDSWMFTPAIGAIAEAIDEAVSGRAAPVHRADDVRHRFDHERLVDDAWFPLLAAMSP